MNNFGQDNLVNIYTDHSGKNGILIFKSFYIIANLLDMNYHYQKIYNIYFNFFHYVKLHEISKYTSKILFLIRFLALNKEMHSLNFDYKSYDEFNVNSWLRNVKICTNEKLNYDPQSEDLYKEIMETFCELKDEKKAQLQAAFDAEDWKNYIIYVHALKSTSLSIGGEKTSALAKKLEKAGHTLKNDDSSESDKKAAEEFIKSNHFKVMELYDKLVEEILDYLKSND